MGQSPESEYYTSDSTKTPFLQGNRTFGTKYPSFDTYTSKITKLAPSGSVIISVRAPVGDINLTPVDLCLGRGVAALVSNDSDNEFLYYLMKYMAPTLIQNQTGSTFGSINKDDLCQLEILLPDSYSRLRIGELLSSIDNEITILQTINDNLLKIGKLLFNDMLSSASLSPGKLSDLTNITMGQSPPGETLSENHNGLLFYQGRSDFGKIFPTPRLYTVDPKRIAPKGSVLVSVRAPVGDLNLALDECCIGRGLAAIESKNSSPGFVHYLMDHLQPDLSVFNGDGTVFGSINKISINNLEINIPDEYSLKLFNEKAKTIDSIIETYHIEMTKLIELRDYLMPKLLSGEIDVTTIELPTKYSFNPTDQ